MAKVIKVINFAGHAVAEEALPPTNVYVRTFDFEAFGGRGFGEFTADKAKAMKFPDAQAAFEFWRTVSKTVPKRPDGKPNRPLTAATVEILEA